MTENNKKFVIQKHTCPVRYSENAGKAGSADLSNGASGKDIHPVGYSQNADRVNSVNLSNGVHWDLMLEAGNILETYRLPVPPEKISHQPVEAIKIFGHPIKFLIYEGSVNKGKGTVEIADSGTYQILSKTDTRIELQFAGKILNGKFTLALINDDRWQFTLEE